MSQGIAETGQWATFFLAEEQFAVPVEEVQEVLLSQPLTRVPLGPKASLACSTSRAIMPASTSERSWASTGFRRRARRSPGAQDAEGW